MHALYLGIISIIEEINTHTLSRFCALQFFGEINFILNYEIRLPSVSFKVWYVLVHFWVLTTYYQVIFPDNRRNHQLSGKLSLCKRYYAI